MTVRYRLRHLQLAKRLGLHSVARRIVERTGGFITITAKGVNALRAMGMIPELQAELDPVRVTEDPYR